MATAPTIDDLTAGAIRRALLLATVGKFGEACAIGEQALAEGGDAAALNAMLGMLRSQSGDLVAAANHLRAAHSSRPGDPLIAGNLAAVLAQLGDYRDALEIATEESAKADRSGRLLKTRAFSEQMLEDYPSAVSSYEMLVAINPQDWESWNNLGNSRRELGDAEGSIAALRRAVEIEPRSPPIRLNLATALLAGGRFEDAEEELRKMAEDFPADDKPLRELHALYNQQLRDEEALEAIEGAVERAPDELELWLALASHRMTLLKHDDAALAYGEVIDRDPANPLGNLGVAAVLEVTNRTRELSAFVSEAAERGVDPDAMNFIRALDFRRKKQFEQGLKALVEVPEELESSRRAHLLGQLEEGAGNHDAAFAAYERMNALKLDDPSQPELRAENYRSTIRRQTESLTDDWGEGWRDVPVDDRPSPVFLLGFPRSGTTLLDTMLMGHPDIDVLEEEPTLRRASALVPFEAVPTATAEQVQAARDAFFEVAVSRTTLKEGKLLIDKNPLSSNAVPLIRRLFPDARIILAIRHPCDVVLSCFVTNFKLNDGMANFLRLDTAAELYDLTFNYYERAQQLLRVPAHRITYEHLVEDQPGELRPLFDFLGVDWHESALDHQSTALGRGHIKTASYAQVIEPVYTRSAGRWRKFRNHLEPVLPTLRPWVEKFGYEL
jgi:tetratricopeptide (TPR) repeat protein